jgi:outer membrane protein OmpA-like peptidoglycan-associated protein
VGGHVVRSVRGRARAPFWCVALGMVLAACSGDGDDDSPTPTPSISTQTVTTSPTPSGTGIDAGPSSAALDVQGRSMRLVRIGTTEIALQFEFVNNTDAPLTPDVLGIDQIERAMLLADLPRSTAYEVLTAEGNNGRISESNGDEVAPGESVTVTAVFTAPPAETTSLTVLVDGLLPVDVPVQPAGSSDLVDDPVLQGGQAGVPLVSPLLCSVTGPPDQKGDKPVEIRLPSDVLFAFGSAELSAAARKAITAVGDEVSASGGTVTIEGHTDAIGSDASNQQLSQRRAAAVRTALQAELGGSFTYRSVGYGESRPVASNTKPDGSDDPDGRAQNRRVEIRAGGTAPAPRATLEPRQIPRDLADAGLSAEVAPLERHAGYLLAQITVTNPTSAAITLGPGSGLTERDSEPVGVTLVDRKAQRRHSACRTPSRDYAFFYLGSPGNDYAPDTASSVPPGAEVTFWAFYANPTVPVTSLDVELGGFGTTAPAQLAS